MQELGFVRRKSARLALVSVAGTTALLKDFSRSSWFWRWFGPVVVQREVRALRALHALDCVPKLLAVVDRRGYVMEHVEGIPCNSIEHALVDEVCIAAVKRSIEQLHAAGWVHGDLKSLGNMVLRPDGTVCMIDFATAFPREGSLGLARRWAFARAVDIDWLALAKLKRLHTPHLLTEWERRAIERPSIYVRLAHAYRWVYRRVRRR